LLRSMLCCRVGIFQFRVFGVNVLPLILSRVIPLAGVFGELRTLGINATFGFLLSDVSLSYRDPRCFSDVRVKLILLHLQFHGRACHRVSSLVDCLAECQRAPELALVEFRNRLLGVADTLLNLSVNLL
jgi:hypothetical protein